MSSQKDLFAKFCPPGSDPIEAWVLRVIRSNQNTTTKAVALALAWKAHLHGNPVTWAQADLWRAAALDHSAREQHARLFRCIDKLHMAGLIIPETRVVVGKNAAGRETRMREFLAIALVFDGGRS